MKRLARPQRVVPKIARRPAYVIQSRRRARVTATYASRRSSSKSSPRFGSIPLNGNSSSSIPVMNTVSNSSPFAACTVIIATRGFSSSVSASLWSDTFSRYPDSVATSSAFAASSSYPMMDPTSSRRFWSRVSASALSSAWSISA